MSPTRTLFFAILENSHLVAFGQTHPEKYISKILFYPQGIKGCVSFSRANESIKDMGNSIASKKKKKEIAKL